MRKRILTFFIALGVILTVGAGLLALQPAVFGIFEEEAGSLRMEKTAVYTGEALLRDRPYAKQVFFGDPYLAAVLQMQKNALAEAEAKKKEEELLELPEEDRTITFTFAGDILFDENYATGVAARQSGILSRFDAGVLELMQGADVFTVNNEFCYSLGGSPLPDKTYTLRARPDTAEWLHEMGADLVTLANNHVFDYGETGLLDTLSTLQDADIPYIGAGADLIVGGHPHVLQAIGAVNGKPVAYSLGNFYFTSYTTDTGLLQVQFSAKEKRMTGLRFVPCLQSGTAVQLLEGAEKERVLKEMRDLSGSCGVSLDEDGWASW